LSLTYSKAALATIFFCSSECMFRDPLYKYVP
jgi:hypothetical protein